jgi:hypothetical protein
MERRGRKSAIKAVQGLMSLPLTYTHTYINALPLQLIIDIHNLWLFDNSAIIALMMEAARVSKMSVKFCQTTWHTKPVESYLHTHHRDNLKLT